MMGRFALVGFAACILLSACSKEDENPALEHLLELGRLPNVSEAAWAGKPTLTCLATSKTICTFQNCTTSDEVLTVQRINPATRTYQRCDRHSQGCDTLEPQVAHSGIWTTLADPVHTATLRVTQRGDFIEYLSQNDDVYIYRGKCRS